MKTRGNFIGSICAAFLMTVLVFLPSNTALAQQLPKVLLFGIQEYGGYMPDVRAKLMATGQFSQVDTMTFNGSGSPPPTLLSSLQQYNAVLMWSDGVPSGNSGTSIGQYTVGAVLAQYVDGGGGLVNAMLELDRGYAVDISFNNSTYQAIVPGPNLIVSEATLGTVAIPSHPIMNGVTSFDGGSDGFRSTVTVASGAYVIAYWSDGNPLIVAREGVGAKSARRVDLNFYPVSNGAYSGLWVPSTNGAQIMANALTWVTRHVLVTNPADQSLKPIGSPLIPTVQVYTDTGSARVHFQVTPAGGGGLVYTHDTVLDFSTPFAFDTLRFPAFTPAAFGDYEDTVTVTSLLAGPGTSLLGTSEFIAVPPHNISSLSFVDPLPNSYASAGIATPIIITFQNRGDSNETNVPLTAVIKDQTGAVVYRDTEYALDWPSGQIRQVTFKNWNVGPGINTFYGIAILPTDQIRSDDTISELVHVRFDYDAAAIGIVNPKPNEQKPFTLSWQPTALFQSHGAQDLFNVPLRVQIRRCSDGGLVFQSDSTIDALNTDQNQQQFSFPSKQGSYDITKVPPGCYTICAIALYPNDADRTNDTICSSFTVIDRLKGDYFVGAGQQFPSVHAAVDSLRFRGIGGNVRLLLTDNSYTENGTDSAATTFGMLDFRGIRGLADTATVTWLPNTGVQTRITFTGTQASCLYFGDLFGGYMTFEGYNPAGAPVPDQLVSEPNKRSMTLVNNGATAGSIFDIEEGSSNITLKDLILTDNAKFTSDADEVVRIYNEQNRNLYVGTGAPHPIRDTVPIHNIRIENCQLGNAKYGIYDHALHTQFNLGKEIFADWRNYNNVFTRNTVGTSTSPISYTGIQFNNEWNLTVSHNEVSNVNGALGGFPNVYGIDQPSVLQSDTGNTIGVWVDANKVHNLAATGIAYGIAFQQAATIYTVGTGVNAATSVLPMVTSNRTTNNMIYDLRGVSANYPLTYTTAAATYSTDRDSIFNNSISTKSAAIDIFVAQSKHAFLWNNIIQNIGAGPYVNYSLQLPRPFTSAVSSDYNLFDLRGSNTFATVKEYDLNSGSLLQTRAFRRLNDWRTFTLADLHSLTGDPLFTSDSLHEPTALSYIESPASNNGAWLNTATQLRDFDGDLRSEGNKTPDIGADEFDGFQYTDDLAALSITTPTGYSATSDTTSVTIENPLWITAQVKNLSSQAVFNVPVSVTVEVAISGGPWTTIYSGSTTPMNFEVNETKSVSFQGPVITQAQAQTGVFRVTVTTPNDQDNANNAAQKVFRVLLKNNATLVSYTSASVMGLHNRDSVTAALRRLNIPYDSLDRSAYGGQDIDYTPWWTLIWAADTTAGLHDSIPTLAYSRVNNYTLTNYTATWTDISTTGTLFDPGGILDAHGAFDSFLLPFDFPYDGAIIPANTTLRAGAGGVIALSPGTTLPGSFSGPPAAVGNASWPALICFFQGAGPYGHPYAPPDNGYYQVDGTAPNRIFTIEYSQWGNYNSTALNSSYQVKLYETTGEIDFIYMQHNFTVSTTASLHYQVGLNGLSASTTPSAASFTSQVYPGYSTPQASTPATDIKWIAQYQAPTLHIPGPGALSFQETQNLERFLQAGQTYAKKSLIMAGQNIAYYNDFILVNNSVTDTEFMKSYLHTVYRANSPASGAYSGWIKGQQTDYWMFSDSLNSMSPDVVAPSITTPSVGSEISGSAYAYLTHPATPSDSGAGVTYTNPKMNTVFYGFDWSDPVQTTPSEAGSLTSGTTRILKGALDFITSHSGTVLPVEFASVTARRVSGNGLISWSTAHQSDIARFEVERSDGSGPGAGDGTLHSTTACQVPPSAPDFSPIGSVGAYTYAFTDAGIDPAKSYTYRIAAIDLSGATTYSPEAELGPDVSTGFTLDQNYPNPASGLTTIRYTLPVDATVTLRILDVTGKVVSTEIVNESMQSGEQIYTLDASKYASGSYIYELTAVQPNGQSITLTKKMTLDK